jgi:hypothetical protein
LTAFHVALRQGHISIVQLFLETYPPKDAGSKLIYDYSECSNLISLALESHEPEIIWIVLDRKLATPQEISQVLTWATSKKGTRLSASVEDKDKAEDIFKLLKQYGKSGDKVMQPINTQAPTSTSKASPKSSQAKSPNSLSAKASSSRSKNASRGNRGRGRGRGRGGHHAPPAH